MSVIDENSISTDCEGEVVSNGLGQGAEPKGFIIGKFAENEEGLARAILWVLVTVKVSLRKFREWC
jgi:hypothetical protein